MITSIPDISTSLSQRFQWAVITAVYSADDTADITILDNNKTPTSETHKAVPIFYNCNPSVTMRSNGALQGSSAAFQVGDNVAVKFNLDSSGNPENYKIISLLSGKRPCQSVLYLIYANGTYICFSIASDLSLTQQSSSNLLNLAIMEGCLLIAQGCNQGNNVYACLPSRGELQASIDEYKINFSGNALSWTTWGTLLPFGSGLNAFNAFNGSDKAYNLTALAASYAARRNNTTDSNNMITDFGYKIITGTVSGSTASMRYNILQGTIYKGQNKYAVGYYLPSNPTTLVQSAWLFAENGGEQTSSMYPYGTGVGDPDNWQLYFPVMAIAKDKLLVKALQLTTVANISGTDVLTGSYVITMPTGTGEVDAVITTNPINTTAAVRTYQEKLILGGVTIENLTYIETFTVYNPFNFAVSSGSAMTPVNCSVTYTQKNPWGGALGNFIASACNMAGGKGLSIQIPAQNPYEIYNGMDWSIPSYGYISGGNSASDTRSGNKDISIMAADNLNGDSSFIIIYSYRTRTFSGTYTGAIGSPSAWFTGAVPVSDQYVTTYKLAWQINGGGVNSKVIASWTDTLTYKCTDCADILDNIIFNNVIETISGQIIKNVSVQINAGVMTYTYCVYDYTSGAFIKRVVGIININNAKYQSGAAQEITYTGSELNAQMAVGAMG